MKPHTAVLSLLLGILLVACAPSTYAPNVPFSERGDTGPAHYYPREPGTAWEYEDADGHPAERFVTTQVMFQGRLLDTVTTRKPDGTLHKQYVTHDRSGVHLHFEDVGSTRRAYDPPLQLYPRAGTLTPGETWGGDARVTETTHRGTSRERTTHWNVTYQHEVLDEQTVRASNNIVRTFSIEYTESWTTPHAFAGRHEEATFWFSPHVGELRTRDGMHLTSLDLHRELPTTPEATPETHPNPLLPPRIDPVIDYAPPPQTKR